MSFVRFVVTRKYAISLLGRTPGRRRRRPGPKPRYDARVLGPLKTIWLASEQMCCKRLKAALLLRLPFYEEKHGALPVKIRRQVLQISPATIDRLLKKVRARYPGKGLSGTRPGSLLKHQPPIRTDNRDIVLPAINELHRTWGLLHHFFCPSLKLLAQIRRGSKTIRKYSAPQTPVQRLLDCPQLTAEQKEALRSQLQQLNPLALKEQIEQQFKLVLNPKPAR